MSLRPLAWVVIQSPAGWASSRLNGSIAQITWVRDGWAVIDVADGPDAGEKWEIQTEHLREFCLMDTAVAELRLI